MSQSSTNNVRLELRVTPELKQELLEISELFTRETGIYHSMTSTVVQLIHSYWKQCKRK